MFEELGIIPVRIELPFRLNHVNCFLAEGETGWTIVDTGLHDERTIKRWDSLLEGKRIEKILVTHYHPDHFGYAGGLQQKTGARVFMTKTDAQAGLKAWTEAFLSEIHTNYGYAGVPEDMAAEMTANTRSFVPRVTPYPKVDHFFEEGEKVVIGHYEYEVIFTPGHSDGMVVFYNEEKKVLLSTDHILPKITPNIAYWFHGIENPLGAYIDSLNKIKEREINFVIPCHGEPFQDAHARIDEILAHHEQRLAKTLTAVQNETTIYEVCRNLFKKELTIHETRFALGETIAHLEYLRSEGKIDREMKDGQWVYYHSTSV